MRGHKAIERQKRDHKARERERDERSLGSRDI